jgi:transposase-like protein
MPEGTFFSMERRSMSLLKKAEIAHEGSEIVLDCPHCKSFLCVTPIYFKIGFNYRCSLCGGNVCLTRERVSKLVYQLNAKLARMKQP